MQTPFCLFLSCFPSFFCLTLSLSLVQANTSSSPHLTLSYFSPHVAPSPPPDLHLVLPKGARLLMNQTQHRLNKKSLLLMAVKKKDERKTFLSSPDIYLNSRHIQRSMGINTIYQKNSHQLDYNLSTTDIISATLTMTT